MNSRVGAALIIAAAIVFYTLGGRYEVKLTYPYETMAWKDLSAKPGSMEKEMKFNYGVIRIDRLTGTLSYCPHLYSASCKEFVEED